MEHKTRVIALEGALNAREMGGLPLKNGRHVKFRRLIRTGRLSDLTDQDCKVLSNIWHVKKIIDLRNDCEISEYPDVMLEGAEFQQIDLLSGKMEGISREDQGLSMIDYAIMRAKNLAQGDGAGHLLTQMYGRMAENQGCIKKIREFFDVLQLQKEGSVIWHCTSGKDRTGVTGALLLYVLGADMETIKEDYLYTNEQNREYRESLLHEMKCHGADEKQLREMRILESVDWAYIQKFFETVKSTYGSVDAFLSEQIGITETRTEIFREMYTEG